MQSEWTGPCIITKFWYDKIVQAIRLSDGKKFRANTSRLFLWKHRPDRAENTLRGVMTLREAIEQAGIESEGSMAGAERWIEEDPQTKAI